MTDQAQLFDGYEVQANYVEIPGLGKLPLAKILGRTDVHGGDEFEATLRFKIGFPTPDAKFDRDGRISSQFGIVFRAFPMREGLQVNAYVSRDEVEGIWRAQHGEAS